MTATNHALSGALIGLTVTQPLIALPLAFVSHFVLDAIPHLGLEKYEDIKKHPIIFRSILLIDALLLLALMIFLFVQSAPLLAFACLFLAGSPDFVWAYRFVFQEKFGSIKPRAMNWFNKFHSLIQFSQTLPGIVVEIPLAIILFTLVTDKL